MEYSVRESFEVMESMPLDEKWRCHLTLPVTDFFGMWTKHYEKLVNMLTSNSLCGPTNGRFWTRTNNYLEDEKFANQSLSAWHPDVSDLEPYMAATKLFTAVGSSLQSHIMITDMASRRFTTLIWSLAGLRTSTRMVAGREYFD